MAKLIITKDELAMEMAERLTDAVDMETLEQFFYEQHIEYYRNMTDTEALVSEARSLGAVDELDEIEVR